MSNWTGRTVTRARATIRARGQMQPCQRCGRLLDLDAQPWHAGHIVDRALGGSNAPANLGPECPHCSTSAGGKLGASITNAQRKAKASTPVRRYPL